MCNRNWTALADVLQRGFERQAQAHGPLCWPNSDSARWPRAGGLSLFPVKPCVQQDERDVGRWDGLSEEKRRPLFAVKWGELALCWGTNRPLGASDGFLSASPPATHIFFVSGRHRGARPRLRVLL